MGALEDASLPSSARRRGPAVLAALAIVAAALLAYAPALTAGFVFDDHSLIENSAFLRGPLWRIWFMADAPDYWPLTWTSLWAEVRLWGAWAPGYHVVNVLLHGAAAVLLWRLLLRLRVPGAWLAGILFAVHPVGVESVAWLSERKNTLSAVLFLAALLTWLRWEVGRAHGRSAPSWPVLSILLYALALLAKTSVVGLPFVLLGISWIRRGRPSRDDLLRLSPYLALSLVMGLVTVWYQGAHATGGELLPRSAAERIGGAAWALLSYLQKGWAPFRLGFIYPRWPFGTSSPLFWLPLVLVVGVAVAVVRLWTTRAGPAAWALAFHGLTVLPVVGLLDMSFLYLAPVSNHLQYLALMAPAALLGYGLALLATGRRRHLAIATSAGVVALLGAWTFQRSADFDDDLTLWRSAAQEQPESFPAAVRFAEELATRGRIAEALGELQSFTQRSSDEPDRLRATAMWLFQTGRFDEALRLELAADAIRPDRSAELAIAKFFLDNDHPREAEAILTPLLAIIPRSSETRFYLGAALAKEDRRDEARQLLLRGLELDPGSPRLTAALGALGASR